MNQKLNKLNNVFGGAFVSRWIVSLTIIVMTLGIAERSSGGINCANAPNTVSVSGPKYVGVKKSVTYACTVGTQGGSYAWTAQGFTITSGQGTSTITIKEQGTPSTSKGDKKVKCVYTRPEGICDGYVHVTVLKPTTQTHAVGSATLSNSANLLPNGAGTSLTTEVGSVITITVKDQFGKNLHSIYNGPDVVTERFVNIVTSNGGALTPNWVPISIPDNILNNGIKLDQTAFSITINVGNVLTPTQIANWNNGTLTLNGKNNVFALLGSGNTPTARGDMEVKVDGHAVTPNFHRNMISTSGNHPPVPYTVTDT